MNSKRKFTMPKFSKAILYDIIQTEYGEKPIVLETNLNIRVAEQKVLHLQSEWNAHVPSTSVVFRFRVHKEK